MATPDLKILIVEDEDDLRQLLVLRFKTFGYSVIEAPSGNQAWEKLKSEPVSIVITDIRMADGTGMELLDRVRKANYNQPAVFVVSGFSDIIPEEVYARGADGFFPKPFNATTLRDTIRKALVLESQKWSVPSNVETESTIHLRIDNMDEGNGDSPACRLALGRGGLCVALIDEVPRIDSWVELDIEVKGKISLKGIGKVRWTKPQISGDHCAGIEILYLEEPGRKQALEWIQQNKPIAFIPNKKQPN